jgi:hypothetical protein
VRKAEFTMMHPTIPSANLFRAETSIQLGRDGKFSGTIAGQSSLLDNMLVVIAAPNCTELRFPVSGLEQGIGIELSCPSRNR